MKLTNSAIMAAAAGLLLLFVPSTSGKEGAHSRALTTVASFDRTNEEGNMDLLHEKVTSTQGQRRLQTNNDVWTQIGSDIDGLSSGDKSGRSVSLSSDGKIVAIGASANDGILNPNPNPGRTSIYKLDGSTWVQLGGDIVGDDDDDESGRSVSLSSEGTIVAIGARKNDSNGTNSGHTRIYKWNDPDWVQLGEDIVGEANGDQFGHSVSLSSDGTIVAIGARKNNNDNGNDSGLTRIYKWNGPDWVQLGQDIVGEANRDQSGYSVSLSSDGTIVAIGAPWNDGQGSNSGHTRIFKLIGSDWVQLGEDIDGEAAFDKSGYSVSLSGDGETVAIGAITNDGNGNASGHTRIFKLSVSPIVPIEDPPTLTFPDPNQPNPTQLGLAWVQLGEDIDGEAVADRSGYSVSLSGDGETVAIGAYLNNGNGNDSGHTRIFKLNDSTWGQVGQDIDGEAAFDKSGYSVSLSGDGKTVAIGAIRNNDNGNNSGHVRVLELDSTVSSSSGGDPHITTWHDEHYEYHGQCDLVMTNDPTFVDGLGLDVHIRTKIVRYWSYIKNVAIKIGNDILEIEGSADANDAEAHYWYNFEYQGDMEDLNGFPVTQKLPSVYKRRYKIDLSSKFGPGKHITVQVYKEFLRVTFNGDESVFGKSVGLLGDFETGKTLGRDGVTVINDFTELGDEWQVLPSEPKLFHEISHPQFPELCVKPEDPLGFRKRRLAESSISVEQAEAVCATLKDPLSIKDCVYDILATQDMDMIGAF